MKILIRNISLIIINTLAFLHKTILFNASLNTLNDSKKFIFIINRESHVIEKGLSYRNPKKGFGKNKIIELIQKILKYNEKFPNEFSSLFYPISIIDYYIKYSKLKGENIDYIENLYNNLLKSSNQSIDFKECGIKEILKADIDKAVNIDYESFVNSRYSIRYFSSLPISHHKVIKAIRLSQKTPSACNRQSSRVHIFEGDVATKLINWQGGASGFEYEIPLALLVTSDMKAFLEYEIFQSYIDGGMFGMNLINALHSQGLGTIPLSCGFHARKLRLLHTEFNVPPNETPILIVGVGNILDNFNVAVSKRKEIDEIIITHNENSNYQPTN